LQQPTQSAIANSWVHSQQLQQAAFDEPSVQHAPHTSCCHC
jgi:hypothetical protein